MLRTRLKVTLAASVLAIAVLPVAAFALRAAAADDDVPGVALPSSPLSGTLNEATDVDDVFAVDLQVGQNFYARMSAPAGNDFDLYLFGPGVPSVNESIPALAYSESANTGNEKILLKNTPQTGTYYLNAFAYRGSGSYAITYGFPDVQPSLTASAPATVKWGASALVIGQLKNPDDSPIASETVVVYAKAYRQTRYYKVGQSMTDTSGAFAVAVTPSSSTLYQARLAGGVKYLPAESGVLSVAPKAYLTRPTAPSTVGINVPFTSSGYLKPRHIAGYKNVKLSCYRLEGDTWWLRKTVYATTWNYGTYSTYVARFSLPYRGRWRIVASVTGDGMHAPTSSSARHPTVVR